MSQTPIPAPLAAGACLALLAILSGFALGGVFGVAEEAVKGRLKSSAAAVSETVYKGDSAAMKAVADKSWVYLQRAHLHGGAMGAAALASILALMLLCPLDGPAKASALALGLGSFLYPLFWLAAGFKAPGLGSTSAAKESLELLSVPGAGLSLLGLCGALFCVARASLRRR